MIWIQLPSATVNGVFIEKNTSYGVGIQISPRSVIEAVRRMLDFFPSNSCQLPSLVKILPNQPVRALESGVGLRSLFLVFCFSLAR